MGDGTVSMQMAVDPMPKGMARWVRAVPSDKPVLLSVIREGGYVPLRLRQRRPAGEYGNQVEYGTRLRPIGPQGAIAGPPFSIFVSGWSVPAAGAGKVDMVLSGTVRGRHWYVNVNDSSTHPIYRHPGNCGVVVMTALSIVRDGQRAVTVLASPIFPLTSLRVQSGAELTFEVFEKDARGLKPLIGKKQLYVLHGEPFWAELKTLEPCESTHPGLALLRDRPTLCGVFFILGEARELQ